MERIGFMDETPQTESGSNATRQTEIGRDTFMITIFKRGNFYINITDMTGNLHARKSVKYVPERQIPTNAAIGSIIGQLVKQRLDSKP